MKNTIVVHKTFLPSFGVHAQNQTPLGLYTVLSINEGAGDCAAYEGIVPDASQRYNSVLEVEHFQEFDAELIEKVRAGGNKVSRLKAENLFPSIIDRGLRYRA
jgi:hypothetical protein